MVISRVVCVIIQIVTLLLKRQYYRSQWKIYSKYGNYKQITGTKLYKF